MYVAPPVAFVPCAKQQNKYSAKQQNKYICIKDLSVVVVIVPVEFPREVLWHLYLFWLFVKRGDMYVAPPVAFVPRAKQQNKYVQK